MVRKPILPEFYGSVFEGYATNYVHRNFWRVAASALDFEEAMAEACYCYYDCRMRYGRTTNSAAQFMSLFKRALSIWFTDWSNWDTRQRAVLPTKDIEPSISGNATLAAALAHASKELSQVLNLILTAPADLLTDLRRDIKKTVDDDRTQCTKVFNRAVIQAGLPKEMAPKLQQELMELLS
jgi:hypothetical protein